VAVAVRLRPITDADEPFLARVYASTRAEELAPVPWTDEQKAAFLAQQFAARAAHYAQHYPGMTRDVIVVDGADAGQLLVDRWEREIRIVDIALLPEHRGSGAGTMLLKGLMDEARAAGKPLSIHVEQMNPALRLYQRLGFAPVAEEGVYLRMEWRPDADADAPTPPT
jgi:ribosomal protein S18 acetylase RimI-like enzyme